MQLHPIPAFDDNYIWILEDGQRAWVVDPGDAQPVLDVLQQHQLTLQGILITHHHGDHTGGVNALMQRYPDAQVVGPARESLRFDYRAMAQDDTVDVLGVRFRTLDVPGHTAGHVAYFGHPEDQAPLLFCGDTLFYGGCGRLFEGTPAQMWASLQSLAALPLQSRVCCAHEYTLSNLRFAQAVEPHNAELNSTVEHCQALRAQNLPTVPSTLATELAVNPFMRCLHPDVIAAAQQHQANTPPQGETVLAALRAWKNNF
jgi:hydroxyacylglutathione hydrolase